MKIYKFRMWNVGYRIQYIKGDVLLFWADDLRHHETHLIGYYVDKQFKPWKCAFYVTGWAMQRLMKYI